MASRQLIERPAESLSGPRVYSTDFHPSHFGGPLAGGDLELATLRSLKVKCLTKGTVTINGGHLLHPAVVGMLRANESILSDGLLLPARRHDKTSFGDYVEDHAEDIRRAGWSDADVKNAVAFLEDHLGEILPWRVEQAVDAFRRMLLGGLSNPQSLIHRNLLETGAGEASIVRMIEDITTLDLREDHSIERYIDQQPSIVRDVLRRYSHACYHAVGTTVVNCETGTDLSPLRELRINDLTGNAASRSDEVLSDVNIFHRCCFATAMDVVNEATLPVSFLDAIPFDQVASIRKALRDQGFQQKYDEIVADFLGRIAGANDVRSIEAWDAGRTVKLVEELAGHFRGYIEGELGHYKSAAQLEPEKEAVRSFADTIKHGLHLIPFGELIPVISHLIAGYETVRSYVRGVGHIRELVKHRDDPAAAADDTDRERVRRAEDFLEVLGPSNKATILDALREIRRIGALNMQPR